MPTYSVTITDKEDEALRGVILDPQAWIEHAFRNKVRKCVDRAIEGYTDKRPGALSESEKSTLIDGIDIPVRKE